MYRIVPLALAVAGLLTFGALTAEAGKKKKSANPNEVVGTIKAINDGGKQITVAVTVKKNKAAVPDREIKITDKTKVEYVKIKSKKQVLTVGQAVTVTLDEKNKDTALSIKVSKGKKKKKTDQ
jgi:hypothetical protein